MEEEGEYIGMKSQQMMGRVKEKKKTAKEIAGRIIAKIYE